MEDANTHELGSVKAKALLDIFAVKTNRNLQDLSRKYLWSSSVVGGDDVLSKAKVLTLTSDWAAGF